MLLFDSLKKLFDVLHFLLIDFILSSSQNVLSEEGIGCLSIVLFDWAFHIFRSNTIRVDDNPRVVLFSGVLELHTT